MLIVLSGPSGVGKDLLLRHIRRRGQSYHTVVTVTTRPRRQGEKDGVDYHFVSHEKFEQMVTAGELLEYARVYGNYYGVPRAEVKESLDKGQDTIIKTDVQGAATIKRLVPDTILIFLAPASMEELADRLKWRHSESDPDLRLRSESAGEEMNRLPSFDYLLISRTGKMEEAQRGFEAIVMAEKCRVVPRRVEL